MRVCDIRMNILRIQERGDNYYDSIVSLSEALDEMVDLYAPAGLARESIVSQLQRGDDVVLNGITYRKTNVHGGGK